MNDAEPPRSIAILGAGPVGLEAALYGRYLGFDVRVYECGRIAEHIRRWGHVRMFSPFAMNASPLGVAALAAQDANWRPPGPDEFLTGNEFADRYLVPLAESDLLAGRVLTRTNVLAVGRRGLLKAEAIGGDERADAPFELLLRRDEEPESTAAADVVIDATGTFAEANWLGVGGIPAMGEQAARSAIEYGLPDILGTGRDQYAGRRTLVAGGGYSAATSVVALAELARHAPATQATWVTRRDFVPGEGPIRRIAHDRLPQRDALAVQANRLAGGASPAVSHWGATRVESVAFDSANGRFAVELQGEHATSIQVDRVIANVGYRPNREIYRELHVHECYATEGPMNLAKTLVGGSGDCLDQRSAGPAALMTTEPNFFILGSKSYGRNSHFLLSVGLEQIRDVFKIITGRESLDLYASMRS